MRNTAIIILLAICVMAVYYTVTNQVPAPPVFPRPVQLPVSIPFMPPPLTLPPLPLNLTNGSSLAADGQ